MAEAFNPYDAWWTAIGHRAGAPYVHSHQVVAVGADEVPPPVAETDTLVLARVDKNTAALIQWTKDEDRRRTIALVVAGASAVFAALKLGWLVIPHLRKRRQLGQLDISPSANPRRRRRRR